MSDLLKKAQDHLDGANAVREEPIASRRMLQWTVAYALVATAEGVWKILELLREVHPAEAHHVAARERGLS